MKIARLLSILLLLTTTISIAQSDDADTDAKYFVSAFGGLNFSQMHSSGVIYEDTNFGTGYSLGLQFNVFPDYEFSNFYLRLAGYYSKETSENNSTFLFQNQSVATKAAISFANAELFFAYRFATQTKVDGYIGAGFLFQQKITKDDDAYTFIDENGLEFPIFDVENFNAPLAYQTKGPKAALGPFVEIGAFVPAGNKLLGVSGGVQYSYFFTNSSGQLKLEKTNLYLRASYELF